MLISTLHAQSVINKTYAIGGANKISFNFDFPKIISISTWDKNEVAVIAKVSINGGDNDEAFILEEKNENGTLTISNKIKDYDKLPRVYVVKQKGSSEKMTFKTKEAFNEYKTKNGVNKNWDYWGGNVDIEITLEIKLPANTETNVKATYGLVELKQFNGPITVNATYGGIDAAITTQAVGSVSAVTKFGQIYTDLKLNITEKTEKDFYTSIKAETGKGPNYSFNSTYGNLYLRKQR